MAQHKLACPAAEFAHPVLSLNDQDIKCQVAGHMRPAEGSPCTNPDGYPQCGIWRALRNAQSGGYEEQLIAQRRPMSATLDI